MSLQRRLRVLHVGKFYPPHMGGIETHLQVLCRELAKHVDVSVLVANDGARDVVDEDRGIRITRAGTRFHVSTAPVCPSLPGHIRRARADILHLHHPNPTAVLAYSRAAGAAARRHLSQRHRPPEGRGRGLRPVLRRALAAPGPHRHLAELRRIFNLCSRPAVSVSASSPTASHSSSSPAPTRRRSPASARATGGARSSASAG